MPKARDQTTPVPGAPCSWPYDAFLSYATEPDLGLASRVQAFLEGVHEQPGLKPHGRQRQREAELKRKALARRAAIASNLVQQAPVTGLALTEATWRAVRSHESRKALADVLALGTGRALRVLDLRGGSHTESPLGAAVKACASGPGGLAVLTQGGIQRRWTPEVDGDAILSLTAVARGERLPVGWGRGE